MNEMREEEGEEDDGTIRVQSFLISLDTLWFIEQNSIKPHINLYLTQNSNFI